MLQSIASMNYSPHVLRCFIFAAMILASYQHSAVASIVYRSAELDLAALPLPAPSLTANIPLTPFVVDVGDTLIFQLRFKGGQLRIRDSSISAVDMVNFNFTSNPVGQTGFLFSGLWHFGHTGGDLLTNDFSFVYGGPLGGGTTNTNLTDTAFTVSSITYTISITFKEPGRPPFSSDAVAFIAFTGGLPSDAISVQAVPEPSSFWGFILAAGLAWRRVRASCHRNDSSAVDHLLKVERR